MIRRMGAGLLPALLCASASVLAQPWVFGDPVTVGGDQGAPHYHHLDGAGRRHVAASDAGVAIVWEDDRSGAPQVYLAVRPHAAEGFAAEYRLSEGTEAYEPAVVALSEGRWLAAWEQDGRVVARAIGESGPGPALELAGDGSRQVSLAGGDERVAAVWARARGRGQLLEATELQVAGDRVSPAAPATAVAPLDGDAYQGHPTAARGPDGSLLVAWEDRRAGHTRLFHSWRPAAGAGFAPARQLNEHNAPREAVPGVGLGSGVMRVVLAADAAGRVRAIWLDKRNAASGYAVWGAASDDGGRSFGANRIVQDELGAAVAQWHAALAGGPAGFVAAWDDAREGWGDSDEAGDVLLSWPQGDGWSADLLVPGASGQGYQGSPAVALDGNGDLHLVWIERDDLTAPTRLRYLQGRRQGSPGSSR